MTPTDTALGVQSVHSVKFQRIPIENIVRRAYWWITLRSWNIVSYSNGVMIGNDITAFCCPHFETYGQIRSRTWRFDPDIYIITRLEALALCLAIYALLHGPHPAVTSFLLLTFFSLLRYISGRSTMWHITMLVSMISIRIYCGTPSTYYQKSIKIGALNVLSLVNYAWGTCCS